MSKRTVSGIMLTLLLIGMLTLAFNVQPVKASGTIYIRADGSIDPPDAPIITYDNITYTFTANIYYSIVVERDNIVIDGAGYTVEGTGAYPSTGIDLSGRVNVTVRNIQIKNFWYGILLSGSSNNSISGNNIANNDYGIYLYYSSNYNSISGNNITNNEHGIWLSSSSNNSISGNTFTNDGLRVYDSYQNFVEGNAVNGKPLVYLEGVANYSVVDAGQVILVNSHSIRVENLNLSNTDVGVELWNASNNSISGNNIANNDYGIYLYYSSNYNSISGNNITANNDYGIFLYYSSNNSISGNNITNNGYGILLSGSSNNSISGNNIANNGYGIFLYDSSNYNSISGNNIANNGYGIGLSGSSNYNSISGNNIANNDYGILLRSSSNYNSISGNNITANNCYGILLSGSSNNSISGNNITANNWIGIYLYYSSNNSISGNNITANNEYGIQLYYSSNNFIYHNKFVNNTNQVYTYGSVNIWDDGYPSGGNYWSDYTGVDADGDGIGDVPYVIDADNRDRYPLMNPWGTGTPVASFGWTPTIPEVGEPVTFDASASMPIGGEIVSYEWDFGDGNYASGMVVTHTYSSAGNYTITLNVTDSEGLWDIEQKQIEVRAPPPPLTVSISPTSVSILVGQSATFTSTVSGGYTPYSYQWYLNGNPVSGANANTWTFTPTTSGIYYVHLKVTDDKGNTAQSDTARISVASVPVGGYSIPIQTPATAKPLTPYLILTAILTIAFTAIKRKTTKKTKKPP